MHIVEQTWDEFKKEFETLSDDVSNANNSTYSLKLNDFINFIENSKWSKERISALTADFDFNQWYQDCKKSRGGMAGSGTVNWDKHRTKRLGQQFCLFKNFAEKENEYMQYSTTFMYAGTHLDDMIYEINNQLFDPFCRDLLTDLSRQKKAADQIRENMETDTVIQLDQESESIKNITINIENIASTVTKSNEFNVNYPDDASRVKAELAASNDLFKATSIRVGVISVVVLPVLYWLLDKFAGQAIEPTITAVIETLKKLIGL